MNSATITVLAPGMFTTVQDRGRVGYQQFGMPVAGAMDQDNYRIGQALVGNETLLGALECTIVPPTLQVDGYAIVAFTGADMLPTINERPVPMYIPLLLRPGDAISGTYASEGMRMYIAFKGGIDVPLVNGSASTYTKARIGGWKGRALQPGDVLSLHATDADVLETYVLQADHMVSNQAMQPYTVEDLRVPIHVVLGPQQDAFTEEGIQRLGHDFYEITPLCDRMGIRLGGPTITHKESADIISDGTVFGSIQVPAEGQPIILMADRQTTGGYTKIGTVITSDLSRLSQMPIGHNVRFVVVSVQESQALYRAYKEKIDRLEQIGRYQSRYVFAVK